MHCVCVTLEEGCFSTLVVAYQSLAGAVQTILNWPNWNELYTETIRLLARSQPIEIQFLYPELLILMSLEWTTY